MKRSGTTTERMSAEVRINPGNALINITFPSYVESYVESVENRKAKHLASIKAQIEGDELELPAGGYVTTKEEAAKFLAHGLAIRDVTVDQVLGGVGLLGLDSVDFHGANITYLYDEEVPLGEYRIDAANPELVVDQLRRLAG
jgi:hypothetical protein